ncbi:glycerophosphoryl diester phosphodiesterase membrane domain-containing protein [Variovorax sp. J22P271]|uniref:glycerophosphoryl diester phosphodiesterase membrane domain-containing protein n=1 Tax=Variovorax davisae TaxID=3053515 RepID=UPI0025754BA2|nr:glycerophosphoryl diester phosphodiesterase membrane domain-containing protein [Variovorax sp. J22P271]MDM0032826.1 glycerophosphoryl diester phosphodiesterase membrane domain-containing protein [Variovorax sp. J22P271]
MTNVEATLGPAFLGDKATVLLGEQTVRSLFVNIYRVYRHHFGVIFWCCVLPLIPAVALVHAAQGGSIGWMLASNVPYFVALFIVTAALTIALSDICLGNRASVRCSYGRIFQNSRWLQVIAMALVVTVGVYLGFLLLVVPGMWFAGRSLFTSTVIVLEGRRGGAAVRRSMELTKGQYWRIFGLLFLPVLAAQVLTVLLVAVVALAAPTLLETSSLLVFRLFSFFVSVLSTGVFLPIISLTTVLLYYDQRFRREAYDAQALSEDLMR